ncbi:serine/threonine-protein phosphatase 6 regulatory ankyrin repeat subunit B-like [Watersipora subatra]|uniref:serine/threonine-protein phosphatase 6 regulatory ankyrin repeat subunit B-like n=1 Tax=Watersipora subatra TaxID=2589382 RepID=UPI00355B6AE8
MEDLLKSYVKYKQIEICELRTAVTKTKPTQLLKLLLTIRNDSSTAVMVAIDEGHTEICRLFLSPISRTADELLWMKWHNGWTVLHIAVLRRYSECVDLLLNTVSDKRKYEFVAVKDEDGNTAMGVAAVRGNIKCIESLLYDFSPLQKESLLNMQNNYLNTPLHCAAYNGHTTALKVMLESVSLPTVSSLLTIKNKHNMTPLEFAESVGEKESSELLKRWEKQSVEKVLALDDTRQQTNTLQEENDQTFSAQQRDTQQKLSPLQMQTEQQAGGNQCHAGTVNSGVKPDKPSTQPDTEYVNQTT